MESRQTLAFYPYRKEMARQLMEERLTSRSMQATYIMTPIYRLNDIKCTVQIDCGTNQDHHPYQIDL